MGLRPTRPVIRRLQREDRPLDLSLRTLVRPAARLGEDLPQGTVRSRRPVQSSGIASGSLEASHSSKCLATDSAGKEGSDCDDTVLGQSAQTIPAKWLRLRRGGVYG